MLGARQSLLTLVAHLDPERFHPVVVVPFKQGELVDQLSERAITYHRVRMGQWRKAKFWARIPLDLYQLRRIAERERIHLVHCNEPHVVPYGLRVARARRVPCVAHVRLDNVDEKLIINYGLNLVDQIVTVSDAVAQQILYHMPERADRVKVVPNGVDADELRNSALPRDEARKRMGARPGDLIVGQVGLLSVRKRCHILIEAFAQIAWDYPKAKLFFVGNPGPSDQPYAKMLTKDIERRGLLDRVRLLPFREDIGSLYSALDVNVLASAQEGFGRVLIESAIFGVPSIATKVGGIPEVVSDGETGMLVPPEDPKPLAQALRILLSSEPERARLGDAARADALERFSIARHTAAMMEVFEGLTAL